MNKLEANGFGKAPFRCVGVFQMPNKETATMQDYLSLPKVTKGGAGSCFICGTGLVFNYIVKDANGDTFIAGCDCIEKINDEILTSDMKKIRREKRDEKKIIERAHARAKRLKELEIEREENRLILKKVHGEFFEKAKSLEQEWIDSIIESIMHYGRMSERQKSAIEEAIKRHETVSSRKNEFFGKIKERVKITVKVERWITLIYGDYYNPSKYLVIMHDQEGRTFKYVGSGSCIPESGKEITMKCTVVDHEDYKGVKQTQINRPAKVE